METLTVHPEVAAALRTGAPVVALESTIISHGLPRPDNLAVARRIEQVVRDEGAVPATVAVVDGRVCVGLDDAQLAAVATRDDVVKVSVRDLATLVARGGTGATTVASTSHVAHLAGIAVFATGGLGGVHRGARATWDESADLTTLGSTPITVVCAGVKSILDVPATLERLETLNIGLLGYGTDRFPGFYLTDAGLPLEFRVNSPEEVAAVMRARARLRLSAALVVANPLPAEEALDLTRHDAVLADGLAAAEAAGVAGKDVTPFLLEYFHRETAGASLAANVTIILRNAALAARIAVAAGPAPLPA
jgi:pseudouridine-5'-phosphate glycosidase